MMRKFVISTDTTADLPIDFITDNDIDIHNLFYSINDITYGKDIKLSDKEFYNKMREGNMPTTMATNPEDSAELFRKRAAAGCDILHIAFSSALSSSYNNTCIAAKEVMDEFPNCNIIVIDSLSASLGEGLIVYRAIQLKKAGMSLDDIADYLKAHIQNFVQFFTVDDLNHLHRGGRVSKTTAVIGTLAGIKPVLRVDEDGKLVSVSKARGRKKSLLALVDKVGELSGSYKNETDTVTIGHGDCLEDAIFVADKIKEKYGLSAIINYVCPTIGAHTGPGVVALFFMGEKRL